MKLQRRRSKLRRVVVYTYRIMTINLSMRLSRKHELSMKLSRKPDLSIKLSWNLSLNVINVVFGYEKKIRPFESAKKNNHALICPKKISRPGPKTQAPPPPPDYQMDHALHLHENLIILMQCNLTFYLNFYLIWVDLKKKFAKHVVGMWCTATVVIQTGSRLKF